MHFTCSAHLILLDSVIVVIYEVYKLWSSSLHGLQFPAISSLSRPNILITLFSGTLSLCCLIVR
jgi:hypothetical protein